MPDLEAYRRSQRPHRHDWQPLGDDDLGIDWCPTPDGCGAVRQHCPELDT